MALREHVLDCLQVRAGLCIRRGKLRLDARWEWALRDRVLRLRVCRELGRRDVPVRHHDVLDSDMFLVE